MTTYSRILVGTDGSESSFRAVDSAANLAAATGASLVIVSAYRPRPPRELNQAVSELGSLAYKVVGDNPAHDALSAAEERAHAAGVAKVETMASEGDAVDVLIELAETEKVQLMVVGNRGLNSLAGRLLGSVPANVTHKAPCDVLIVHTTP